MSEPTAGLDAIADELYTLRPDRFAAVRDEQVKRARAEGQAALARELSRLRRPTQSAWLINLLWRDQRAVLEQLFELAAELGRAYAEASGEELQRVTAQQHQLEAALLRRARELGAQAGVAVSADTEREAQETLTAALARAEVADEVRGGRLTKPVAYAGFGAPGAAAAVGLGASSEAGAVGTEPVPIERLATRAAQRHSPSAGSQTAAEHGADAEAERREAERQEAERRARAERQQQAEQRLAQAQAEAESAAATLDERRQAGAEAEQQRQALRARLSQLQAEVRDVEQALGRADQSVLDAAKRRLEAEHAADLARESVRGAEQDLAAATAAG
jgi:hypothetical protein